MGGYKKVEIKILQGELNFEEKKHVKKMLRKAVHISFTDGISYKLTDEVGSVKHFKIGTKKEGTKYFIYRGVIVDYLNE